MLFPDIISFWQFLLTIPIPLCSAICTVFAVWLCSLQSMREEMQITLDPLASRTKNGSLNRSAFLLNLVLAFLVVWLTGSKFTAVFLSIPRICLSR
jgi:hypothetical protein